ncbi:hypothetical protein LXA43DRAFT_213836 [Ganoderma leucocontextum]|nr:hypothetical protein LXA43DRAFT_213836 [Ganoderma leucocontextum]
MAPEDCWRGGLAKGVPRTLTEHRLLADGNPRPLCTIPFNVSMSNAKAGTFDRAHEPVFVYLADARMKAGIRIRLFIEGTPWAEMKARPFHDGKSITKGDLAMSIATELEKMLTTNKREDTGEWFFVDLVQECQESFRPTFRPLSGGA